jgi:hypothetical protein
VWAFTEMKARRTSVMPADATLTFNGVTAPAQGVFTAYFAQTSADFFTVAVLSAGASQSANCNIEVVFRDTRTLVEQSYTFAVETSVFNP